MSRFRFVHAADLHLDTPFDGLSRLGASVPTVLRDASLQAFDNLIDLTLESGADLLILAGDIYDGPSRGLRAQLRVREGLKRLSDAGVQVALVHGNHDPVEEGWSAIGDWPDGVTAFPTGEVGSVALTRDGRDLARVYGISYAKRATKENLARRFPGETDAPFAIGVLHANVGNNAEHAAYSPCTLDDLRAADMDYWALGHIHRYQQLSEHAPTVIYPGVIQGRSPKPSEQGAKGAVVVDVAEGRVAGVTFRDLDVVRFESFDLDIADIPDTGALQDRLQQLADAAVDAAAGRQLVLRARLTGRGPVHAALRAGDGTGDLVSVLQDASDRVWWDKIVDDTAPPLDLDAIRRRGDFSSELLQRVDTLLSDPDAFETFFETHARASGDRRIKPFVESASHDDEHAALETAAREALARLEPEDEG